jgi:hypothetical protein
VVSKYWSARLRTPALAVDKHVKFSTATLVENYNAPDMLSISGRQSDLAGGMSPSWGILLTDSDGTQRFSGVLTSIEELGNGTANLIYTGDMVRLWHRVCYPVPSAAWSTAGQTSAYDVQTGSAETKLLGYIDRNCGPSAVTARKYAALTLPTSSNRGPTGTSSVRFDILGQLVATLAESAALRVQIIQTYTGWTPHLAVTITAVPDLSASVRFGTATTAPLQLSQDWRYKITVPTVTTALSAAGGEGTARILNYLTDSTAETLWGDRIEGFVDQRNTTDSSEITNGLTSALTDGAGPTEVAVPLPNTATVAGLPLGALIAAKLGSQSIVDRLRQKTTVLGGDGATVTVTGVLGSPDAGVKTPTQRQLADVLARVQNLERR